MKLTTNEELGKKELQEKLQETFTKFKTNIIKFDEKNVSLFKELHKDANECVQILTRIENFIKNITDQQRQFLDSKSDRWIEGDRGSDFYDWMESWESSEDIASNYKDIIIHIDSFIQRISNFYLEILNLGDIDTFFATLPNKPFKDIKLENWNEK